MSFGAGRTNDAKKDPAAAYKSWCGFGAPPITFKGDLNPNCTHSREFIYSLPDYFDNIAMKHKLADVHMPAIEAASPGGGVYLNEMDPLYQGDWKQSLFGANHDKLLEIKHKYDPEHLLWGGFTIGSGERVLQGDGRLCKI